MPDLRLGEPDPARTDVAVIGNAADKKRNWNRDKARIMWDRG